MKKILALLLTLVSIFTLISCSTPPTQIDTRANHVFFATTKSDLHNRELKKAFKDYFKEKYTNIDVNTLADYEIYNYTPKRESNKYDLDIFEVAFCDGEGLYNNENYFFAKHKDTLYPLTSPIAMTMAITNIAITDINRDGYIEILTSVARFGHNYLFDKPSLNCDLRVIDTKTEFFIKSFALDYDLYYFKENQDGVVCLYGTNDNLPTIDNVVDGKLDERFYDTTNECCSTPTLNTKKFNFKQLAIQESCDLFSVEVTIDDKQLSFPYSFERTQVTLTIKTKMTYLGEPLDYTTGTTAGHRAQVYFVNETTTIKPIVGMSGQAITNHKIATGQVLTHDCIYYESGEGSPVGTYDMLIEYDNDVVGIKDSILIKDFLTITR